MHKTRQIHYLQSNITKQTNIALLHTIQFPIGCTSHTLLVEGHVSCFIACAFQHGNLVQHHKCCAMCSPHQSHISAVQQFPHIALAHALYSIPMSILCASMQESYSPCQIWTMDAPFWCTTPLQMHFMQSKQIHFNCSCIPILFLHFHPSKPMTQLCHNTRTFKIRHFGILCQDSKDRPCPLQCPTPSFA